MKLRTKIRNLAGIFMLSFVLLAVLVPAQVKAASNPLAKMSKTVKSVISAPTGMGCDFFTPHYSTNFTMTATSSNKKVATVKVYSYQDEDGKYYKGYEVTRKGAGTTKIKVTVKLGGKTYTRTCKYTYYKYKTPFSSFKIGSKNYTSTVKKNYVIYTTSGNLKGKLSYKLKKRYKVTWIGCRYTSTTKSVIWEEEDGTPVYGYSTVMADLKNGSSLPANAEALFVRVQNTKTKLYTTIVFYKK